VTEPFAMAVWEAAAYLVPDDRRQQVFDRVRKATRLDPLRLAALPDATLAALIADGGMQPDRRARKVKAAADVAIEFGPDLAGLARRDPAKARRIFRRFPGIGEPGADKILLLNGVAAGLAPESNALRVLLRLGFGRSGKGYSAEYRSVQQDIEGELAADPAWRVAAHQLLRQHGQTLCKANAPRCGECPLAARCPAGGLSVSESGPGKGR
jgi:endonuclease-3